jgi:hypothetical protein
MHERPQRLDDVDVDDGHGAMRAVAERQADAEPAAVDEAEG